MPEHAGNSDAAAISGQVTRGNTMDFKLANGIERNFYKQDFTPVNELLKRIRHGLVTGDRIDISDLDFEGIWDYDQYLSMTYISLFQSGIAPIRFGNRKKNLMMTINRNIEMLRNNKFFDKFDVADPNKCRILLEYVIERQPVLLEQLQQERFDKYRFEIGINGLELKHKKDKISYYYMPTDATINSHMGLQAALRLAVSRTPIRLLSDKIPVRMQIFRTCGEYEIFKLRSRAFVTYKDECVPLYRGNILYDDFSYDTVLYQFLKSSDWLIENMLEDGRFMYYYDCSQDNNKDHEHPNRKPDDLYYNDLRHCGGAITLIRAYTQTGDKKYLDAAKRAIDFTTSISKEHTYHKKKAMYVHYNKKGKLGGTGLALIMMMQYRIASGDRSYDKYIKGYARHIMSRMTKEGELMGYYIHPMYNDGKPLIRLTDQERRETFSFYYPGEALLGLALFANHFLKPLKTSKKSRKKQEEPDEEDKQLVEEVRAMAKIALDWIVNERPKFYKELFTALPSDAWLMQAIEEWAEDEEFRKQDWLNFVYTDAKAMMERCYQKNDNPYIDYEGGYYYNYGDHFYPDGARSEGLIAAYYLAKKQGETELAAQILDTAKKAAKSQFQLFNDEKSGFSHRNPEKSAHGIRFKATRQWVRVDSVQHVDCFFIRLYWAENPVGSGTL